MQRSCDLCGRSYEAKQRRSRFCSSNCRVRSHRGQVVVAMPEQPSADQPPASSLVESYRSRLAQAGRLDTPEGIHVLMLAELLTSAAHTASGAASLSRELRAAMEAALRGAAKSTDALDELGARRAQKASGA